MCGRFVITEPSQAMARLFDADAANDLPPVPDYNVCPTDPVHVLLAGAPVPGAEEGGPAAPRRFRRRLRAMRWGLVPSWYKAPNGGPLLINARSDTVAEKPAFREAIRQRRCILPASGFYEWTEAEDGKRLPWFIRRADGGLMLLAGLWQEWERDGQHLTSCAMVTCDAAGRMAQIHHRMPVILEPGSVGLWLGEEGKGAAVLMRPVPEGVLEFHRVGTAVNSNRAEGPELIEPWSDDLG